MGGWAQVTLEQIIKNVLNYLWLGASRWMIQAPTAGPALPGLQSQGAGWGCWEEGLWRRVHTLTLPTFQKVSASWELALPNITLATFFFPGGTQGISTLLWTVISNGVIKRKRGGERCLPASSITSRDIGTSLIKIRRLGFQLMRHSIPAAHSRVLGGSVNAVSRVMACVIPIRISGHTQC